jgi:beta-mannosidase
MNEIQLIQGWAWKQRNSSLLSVLEELDFPSQATAIQEGWTLAQGFPSEIHVELLKKGLIPDPYVGFNEHRVQCK